MAAQRTTEVVAPEVTCQFVRLFIRPRIYLDYSRWPKPRGASRDGEADKGKDGCLEPLL